MLEGKEARAQKLNDLIEAGKQKGMLSYKEIMDALEELELDQEQIEEIKRQLVDPAIPADERAGLLREMQTLNLRIRGLS